MTAVLDHVIVFCSTGAPEADDLVRLGLREGLPNTHPGQGTANCRFFFQNAYLELLWVSDPKEFRASRFAGHVSGSAGRVGSPMLVRSASRCVRGPILEP
jgi:hypothetical protein